MTEPYTAPAEDWARLTLTLDRFDFIRIDCPSQDALGRIFKELVARVSAAGEELDDD